MSRKLPPFSAVKAFEAAARHGSFARAAQELDVTSTAISQHVKGLEKWLGEQLFERKSNGVSLTSRGKELLGDVSRILDNLATLLPPEHQGVAGINLTVAAPTQLVDGWLRHMLPDFYEVNPGISVSFVGEASADRLETDSIVDFVISDEDPSNPQLLCDPLFEDQLVPVCSEQYRDLLGLYDQRNWRSATLLHDQMRPDDWQCWANIMAVTMLDWQDGLSLPNHHLAMEAAKQSRGLFMSQWQLVKEALLNRSLVSLSETPMPTGRAYHLIRRRGHKSPAAIQLRSWLLTKLRT